MGNLKVNEDMPLRIISKIKLSRRPVEYCYCGKATNKSKPFCADHVLEMPYVKALLKRLTKQC
jgi:hypothetical protein